ncbi:hypothetical protein MJ575_28380 [Klebsiella pneumoniae]|nr:hypothetical protein MJ575_28380 [Klebsiella pneumoniae]
MTLKRRLLSLTSPRLSQKGWRSPSVSAVLLKTSKVKEEDDISAATRRMHDMKAGPKAPARVGGRQCHQRPGAMCVKSSSPATPGGWFQRHGAGVLRKKVQDAGPSNISVTNSAINNLAAGC